MMSREERRLEKFPTKRMLEVLRGDSHHSMFFSLRTLIGTFYSEVLLTRQWIFNTARELGAGVYLSLISPLDAMDSAALFIRRDDRCSIEFIVFAIH